MLLFIYSFDNIIKEYFDIGRFTMEYTRKNQGVCSRSTKVVIEDGIIKDVEIVGGCNGNIKGLIALVKGMKAEDAIERLSGIRCGFKSTSCPDQLAMALREALDQQ
jgi:uncharacterized protein (TIGR03905 family)